MKGKVVPGLLRALVVAAVLAGAARAEMLVQWDFNSRPPDPTNSFPTGSLEPIFGAGTASLVGGATATFASGTGSSDPVAIDDSGWNTASYPARTAANKTRGVQFQVSTLGFQQIRVTWDQRHSDASSRHLRFQYSTNGVDFVDGPALSAAARSTTGQEVFEGRAVDLTSYPVVNNKSNFAFRIVAEFEDSATGAGLAEYRPTFTNGSYAATGTWRFDTVTVSGEIFSGNEFPSISTISNQTMPMNMLSDEIPFAVGDFETPATDLAVTAMSSNHGLIPDLGIVLGGMGSNRMVQVFPNGDQHGVTTITITVTDANNNAVSRSFTMTVLPDNTPPLISSFTNYHAVVNMPLGPISFVVADNESAAGDLIATGTSSNPTLIPDANLAFGGGGGNRTVTVTPAPDQTGNAIITVTVSDGTLSARRQFAVMVVPSVSVLLCDEFAYPDGPLNANSGFRWGHHSGIGGQIEVLAEEVQLSSSDTEDVSATLIGAPYAPASGKVLHAAFTVNFRALPASIGEYFAHFRGLAANGPFFARVFATTTNAAPGSYRLAIGNSATTVRNAAVFPRDLAVDTEYVVVVRYDVAAGASALWVNPRSETDTNVVAFDPVTPAPVLAWAFRQSSTDNGSIGTLTVDDLKVGLSFSDVTPGHRLRIGRRGAAVEISWPAAATDESLLLEKASDLAAPDWQIVPEKRVRANGRDHVTIPLPTGNVFYRLAK